MALIVVRGAILRCTLGMTLSQLCAVTSQTVSMIEGRQIATVQDCRSMINIAPFGMCFSLANPSVASATAAALGVLTPMPCIPSTATPWICPKSMMTNHIPTLTSEGKLLCAHGGQITVAFPGQTIVSG